MKKGKYLIAIYYKNLNVLCEYTRLQNNYLTAVQYSAQVHRKTFCRQCLQDML